MAALQNSWSFSPQSKLVTQNTIIHDLGNIQIIIYFIKWFWREQDHQQNRKKYFGLKKESSFE